MGVAVKFASLGDFPQIVQRQPRRRKHYIRYYNIRPWLIIVIVSSFLLLALSGDLRRETNNVFPRQISHTVSTTTSNGFHEVVDGCSRTPVSASGVIHI